MQPQPAAPAADPLAPKESPGVATLLPRPAVVSTGVEPRYGGILIKLQDADPPAGWDRMRTSTSRIGNVSSSIFGDGNIVKSCRHDTYAICPGLAESWEANDDFTQWTFKIRDNVKWHDGQPLTADDASFWINLAAFGVEKGGKLRAPAFYAAYFGDPTSIDVLPGNRVRITIPNGAPLYLDVIRNPRLQFQHAKHLFQPKIDAGEVGVAPIDVGLVGTGPFKLVKFTKGSRVTVTRNEEYFEKDAQGRQLPFLDGIEYAIVRDSAAMDAAFRVGQVDAGAHRGAGYLTRERHAAYMKTLGDKVRFAQVYGPNNGLGWNVLKEGPWQDVRVRQAVGLWMDKSVAPQLVNRGFGYLSPILPPDSPFNPPGWRDWPGFNMKNLEKDRVEAKRLLAAAGYADGFDMNMMCRSRTPEACQYYEDQLRTLGIRVELKMLDDAGWAEGRVSLDYDAQHKGLTGSASPEGSMPEFNAYSESTYGAAKHEDAKVISLYGKLQSARGFDERAKIWHELIRYYLVDQAYVNFCCGSVYVIPYRVHVMGYTDPKYDAHHNLDYAETWLDR